jgi:hypothetical protein
MDFSRIIPSFVAVLLIGITGCAFVLSYTSLTTLAVKAGIPAHRAFLWPLCLDLFQIVASLVVVQKYLTGQKTYVAWSVVMVVTGLSILFNILESPSNIISQAVYALPPVTIFIAFESLMGMLRSELTRTGQVQVNINHPPVRADQDTCPSVDTPIHHDPIAQFFSDHPGISLSKAARSLGIPRTTLKRRYDVLVSAGLVQVIP